MTCLACVRRSPRFKLKSDRIVEHERQDKLRHWKFRMKTDPKGIGNWLKTKNNPSIFHIKNDNGDVSDTLASGAQIVYEFWNQFWTHQKQISPSDDQISDLICQGLPSGPNFMQHPPKDVEIWYKMTQSRGSHGCDGWKGNELRHLPLGAAQAFHAIIYSEMVKSWGGPETNDPSPYDLFA